MQRNVLKLLNELMIFLGDCIPILNASLRLGLTHELLCWDTLHTFYDKFSMQIVCANKIKLASS